MTEYAQILVLRDDLKRMELDKRLMAACHDVEMKEAAAENARLKAEVEQLQNRCDFLEGRGQE